MAQWMIGESLFHQKNYEAALREYPELYRAGRPTVRVDSGAIDVRGINAFGFGVRSEPDWDALTQAALAAAALSDAGGPGRPSALQKELDGIFIGLSFPASYESPRGYAPRAEGDRPVDNLLPRIKKLLEGLSK